MKLTLVEKASTAAERARATARHLPAQADRAALRDRGRGAVLQGRDPGAVPEPGQLRRRLVRRPGRRPALLRRQRRQAHAAAGRAAGRLGEEPDRLRPGDQRRRGPGTAGTWCSSGCSSSAVISVAQANAALRTPVIDLARVRPLPNGCANSRVPLLLRLRRLQAASTTRRSATTVQDARPLL